MTREEAIAYFEERRNYNTHNGNPAAERLAIEALRAQQESKPQWISVKDRLPEDMGAVLVIVSGTPRKNITLDGAYEFGEYDPDEGWILEMWPEWKDATVTHWMPLPEPPEE